jgi:hypothetical protein
MNTIACSVWQAPADGICLSNVQFGVQSASFDSIFAETRDELRFGLLLTLRFVDLGGAISDESGKKCGCHLGIESGLDRWPQPGVLGLEWRATSRACWRR